MPTRRTVEQLRQQGLDCAIVGGAGTGTFQIESTSGIYTEMQCGSYVFMDADYARNLDDAGKPVSTFRHALFVLATVMSAPHTGLAVLDAGHKAVSDRFRHADGLGQAGHSLRQRLGRARQTARRQRDHDAETRRKVATGARPLRPDGRSLRLVCRRARRPGGKPVAGGRREAAMA